MSLSYLDKTGLAALWAKIKAKIGEYLPLSAGESNALSDNLYIKANSSTHTYYNIKSMDVDIRSTEGGLVDTGMRCCDKNDYDIGQYYTIANTNAAGITISGIEANAYLADGSERVSNYIMVAAHRSGSRSYTVADPSAFCSAIRALPLDPQGSLNPLESNLELNKANNPRYYTKSTSIYCTEADNGMSSGTYYAGLFNVDASDTIIGTFETAASSNGAISSRMTARNSGTGTQVTNMLTLGVYNDGRPFVSITNNDKTREAWQIALGLAFAPGNSCNLASMTCAGHLTSKKGSVVFYIPLAKPIASTVSNVSVSSTNCEIRHSDGGYIGSGNLSSIGTISSSIAAGRQGVSVTLSLSKASTFTNNAPITIRFYSTSTLTFS